MRFVSKLLVVLTLALVGSSPAWGDVVTLVGHDTCPGGGNLVFGPGFAATLAGSDGSRNEIFCMEPNYAVHPGSGQAQNAAWTEICFADGANCSGSQQVLACVVCTYPDPVSMAPASSVGALVLLVSAIIGSLYYQARRNDMRSTTP